MDGATPGLGLRPTGKSDEADLRDRAMAFALFWALREFCFDGNKRTARLMMNGMLISPGLDAISMPAARGDEFNGKMARAVLGEGRDEADAVPGRVRARKAP